MSVITPASSVPGCHPALDATTGSKIAPSAPAMANAISGERAKYTMSPRNVNVSANRSSVESMNAPYELAIPRARAIRPSKMSATPPSRLSHPAAPIDPDANAAPAASPISAPRKLSASGLTRARTIARSIGPITHISQSRTQRPRRIVRLRRTTSASIGRPRVTIANTGIVKSSPATSASATRSIVVKLLRPRSQESKHLRPQEDERPASLARSQHDHHAAPPLHLVLHVFQPVVVKPDVLPPPKRRSHFAASKVQPHARPLQSRWQARLPIGITGTLEQTLSRKFGKQRAVHLQHCVALRGEQLIDSCSRLRTNLS